MIKDATETLKKRWSGTFEVEDMESVEWFVRNAADFQTNPGFYVGCREKENYAGEKQAVSCIFDCKIQVGEEALGIIKSQAVKINEDTGWGPVRGWLTSDKLKSAIDCDGNLTLSLDLTITDIQYENGKKYDLMDKKMERYKNADVKFQHDRIAAAFGREDGDLTVLLDNEKEMLVHSQILSIQSDVFQMMLAKHPSAEKQDRVLDMKAYPAEAVELFLKYLYVSDVTLVAKAKTVEQRIVLYKMAEMYDIPPLLSFAMKHLADGAKIALKDRDFEGFHKILAFLKSLRRNSLLEDVRSIMFDSSLRAQAFEYLLNYT